MTTDQQVLITLLSLGYLLGGLITAVVVLDRMLPMVRGVYGVGWVRSGSTRQKRIARTRAFWVGLFWPLVVAGVVLYWAVVGLYKLITVPFRKLNP